MNLKRVERWIWILIYGGMLLLALGIATQRRDPALGWPILVVGALLAVVGVLLICLRARAENDAG